MRFLFRNHAGRREWSEKLKEWRGEPHQIRGVYFAELFFKSKINTTILCLKIYTAAKIMKSGEAKSMERGDC